MNMKKFLTVLALGLAVFAVSCSNDTTDPTNGVDGKDGNTIVPDTSIAAATISIADINASLTGSTCTAVGALQIASGVISQKTKGDYTGITSGSLTEAQASDLFKAAIVAAVANDATINTFVYVTVADNTIPSWNSTTPVDFVYDVTLRTQSGYLFADGTTSKTAATFTFEADLDS